MKKSQLYILRHKNDQSLRQSVIYIAKIIISNLFSFVFMRFVYDDWLKTFRNK